MQSKNTPARNISFDDFLRLLSYRIPRGSVTYSTLINTMEKGKWYTGMEQELWAALPQRNPVHLLDDLSQWMLIDRMRRPVFSKDGSHVGVELSYRRIV